MSKKLRALLVKENELPVEVEIPNNLTSLQKQVGGYIEYFYMPEIEDAVIICNEEGKYLSQWNGSKQRGWERYNLRTFFNCRR